MPMNINTANNLDWQPALGSSGIVGGLDDIDQSICIILSTPPGSDPHRPEFAVDLRKYIDWPQTQAVAYIVRDARAAILRWEPRIKDVQFTITQSIGAIEIVVDWLPAAVMGWQRSLVALSGAVA